MILLAQAYYNIYNSHRIGKVVDDLLTDIASVEFSSYDEPHRTATASFNDVLAFKYLVRNSDIRLGVPSGASVQFDDGLYFHIRYADGRTKVLYFLGDTALIWSTRNRSMLLWFGNDKFYEYGARLPEYVDNAEVQRSESDLDSGDTEE